LSNECGTGVPTPTAQPTKETPKKIVLVVMNTRMGKQTIHRNREMEH